MVFPDSAARNRPSARAATAQVLAPYALVREYLKHGLSVGRWPPGALMPSDSELVAQFGVSRMTVTRALRELQTDGLVTRVQGLGTYAAHLAQVSSSLTIRDLHEEITARGHRHHARVHLSRQQRATAGLAGQLGLAPGAPVFHTLIVHFEDDVALQCEDRFVNPRCAPNYLKTDFTKITPTHYLLQVAPLWEAQYSIEAGAPRVREARLLGIPGDEPCLIIVRRTVNRDIPITLARLVHPGSRYRVQGQFKP
ncbi:UTRA domain-containing protein [Roseateles sp.]|uniref:UTRA domain-containing protein n=1 Tax=Roseateles sp. TaxID=1971397 RepID=UPI00286A75D5|nr:UTRA domain-containing protein [Roseateles sp.]